MEDMGQWVRWGPGQILTQEGPPLAPLTEVLMEAENVATQVQKDGATAEDDAIAE